LRSGNRSAQDEAAPENLASLALREASERFFLIVWCFFTKKQESVAGKEEADENNVPPQGRHIADEVGKPRFEPGFRDCIRAEFGLKAFEVIRNALFKQYFRVGMGGIRV
jgi:hypothetical protein